MKTEIWKLEEVMGENLIDVRTTDDPNDPPSIILDFTNGK